MQAKPQLIEAVESGNIKLVKELLKAGADVNATNSVGFTAVTLAAMYNNLDLVRVLIAAGADLHKRARNNQNAIDWARAHDNKEMLKLMEQRH